MVNKQMNDIQSLGGMLSYRRPAGSRSEKAFIRKYLIPFGMNIDRMGNLYKRIGDSPILWSSHTDTVHTNGGKQKIILSEGKYKVFDKDSNCLGADDTAGVWIMTQMMEAKVPGLYVFHRGEERGGYGSKYISLHNKELLKDIQYAIAFDRYGKNSIITFQAGERCCSEDFSASLAAEIGMSHKSDDGGTFTDTANYTGLIGECTNLSVGYKAQHCKTEELDTKYLFELRDAMMDFNHKNLVSKRKPGEFERKVYRYSGNSWWGDFWDEGSPQPNYRSVGSHSTYEKMVTLIKDNPREVADWMEENGVSYDDVRYAVWGRGGIIRKEYGSYSPSPAHTAKVAKDNNKRSGAVVKYVKTAPSLPLKTPDETIVSAVDVTLPTGEAENKDQA